MTTKLIEFTVKDLAWLIVAVEDRIKDLDDAIEWNDSQGMPDAAEEARRERKVYGDILVTLTNAKEC